MNNFFSNDCLKYFRDLEKIPDTFVAMMFQENDKKQYDLYWDNIIIPLKEIKYENKNLEDTFVYKYLNGDKKSYFEKIKQGKLQFKKANIAFDQSYGTKKRIERLIKSLEKNGFDNRNPIIIDENNNILDGLHRSCWLLRKYGEEYKISVIKKYIDKNDLGNIAPKDFEKFYEDEIFPAFKKNNIAIAFSSSNYYVPYLSVVLLSLADTVDSNKNYDIVILTRDISDENKELLQKQIVLPNISLRFYDVSKFFENRNIYTPKHIPSVTIETYYRLCAPLIFKNYPKVIFLDSDTLILKDISELYNINVSGYALAATTELLFPSAFIEANLNPEDHLKSLGMGDDTTKYFQAGVLLMNCDYFNQNSMSQKLLNNVSSKAYHMVDQDALNELCYEKTLIINNAWNYVPLSQTTSNFLKYMPQQDKKVYFSIKEPKIIHFIGASWKPWCKVDGKYDYIWWQYARKTPYYEQLLLRLNQYIMDKQEKNDNAVSIERMNSLIIRCLRVIHYKRNYFRYLKYKILSKITLGKTRKRYKQKRKELRVLLQKTRKFNNEMGQR